MKKMNLQTAIVIIIVFSMSVPVLSLPNIPIDLKAGNEWIYEYKAEAGDIYTVFGWGKRYVRIVSKSADSNCCKITIQDTIAVPRVIQHLPDSAWVRDTVDSVANYELLCCVDSGKTRASYDTTSPVAWFARLLLTTDGIENIYSNGCSFSKDSTRRVNVNCRGENHEIIYREYSYSLGMSLYFGENWYEDSSGLLYTESGNSQNYGLAWDNSSYRLEYFNGVKIETDSIKNIAANSQNTGAGGNRRFVRSASASKRSGVRNSGAMLYGLNGRLIGPVQGDQGKLLKNSAGIYFVKYPDGRTSRIWYGTCPAGKYGGLR